MQTENKIRQDITEYLSTHGILTLATSINDTPWVCTLYYGIDENLNLYVVTDPHSRHGLTFGMNPTIAFNIFESDQKITEPKRGIQGQGEIEAVKGPGNVARALLLWHQANPGIEENISVTDIIKKITDTKIYKIRPTYLKFFNKQLYGKKEYGELKLESAVNESV